MAYFIGLNHSGIDSFYSAATMKCRAKQVYLCFSNQSIAEYFLEKFAFFYPDYQVMSDIEMAEKHPSFDRDLGSVVYFSEQAQIDSYLTDPNHFKVAEIIKPVDFVISASTCTQLKVIAA